MTEDYADYATRAVNEEEPVEAWHAAGPTNPHCPSKSPDSRSKQLADTFHRR